MMSHLYYAGRGEVVRQQCYKQAALLKLSFNYILENMMPIFRILLIDDEPDLLDISKEFLELDQSMSVEMPLPTSPSMRFANQGREHGSRSMYWQANCALN